jgi:hypothetical protein
MGCRRCVVKSLREARTRLFAPRPLQIAFHKAPLGPVHGGAANRHRAGDLVIAAAGVGGQQYLGSLELGDRRLVLDSLRTNPALG